MASDTDASRRPDRWLQWSSRIGVKRATTLFEKEGYSWATVVKAFEDKGLTEDDALCNARLARILTNEDYDSRKQEPRLWTPTPEYQVDSGTGVQIEVS